MDQGEDMRDDIPVDEQDQDSTSGFLSPAVCAVSAFTLAVVALFGQNAVSIGVGTLLESQVSQSGDKFFVAWGLAVVIQVGLVWLLARRSVELPGGWEALLGRAAIVLSVVALAAGVMVVLGGLLNE